ncbi:glycosyltransferase [Catenovulum maritimum]|uniref:glycosyltransferase n=1 Tax=Catenovulum maritimum TaxID=1513271 RepID=UPI00065FBA32|nr:glycosyltransferase [Catenovulum maritimum]
MKDNLWTIKALWIGERLSLIEQVSLASFVKNGHKVELFTYGKVQNIPEGVIVRDANEILAENKIYKYKKKPSYAGFANWFRYLMLYKEGGVWIDTDVVCLKPFDFDTDLFFGKEQFDKVNCAVVGAKPGLEIFNFLANQVENPNDFLPYDTTREKRRKLFRKYIEGNKRGNVKWGETGPIGFTKALEHFGLFEKHKLPMTAFYPIHSTCWDNIFDETFPTPEPYFPDTYAIHLWNEMMRREDGFSKDATYSENSLIECLKRRYL